MKKAEENDLLEKLKHNANGWQEAIKDRDAWQSEYRSARAEVERVKTERDTLSREKRDLEKKSENMKKVIEEQGIRFRNKLMSVYYLLGTIKKMGTHHEKEVAVRYLQTTVEDLIRHDGLGWDQDLFELPF